MILDSLLSSQTTHNLQNQLRDQSINNKPPILPSQLLSQQTSDFMPKLMTDTDFFWYGQKHYFPYIQNQMYKLDMERQRNRFNANYKQNTPKKKHIQKDQKDKEENHIGQEHFLMSPGKNSSIKHKKDGSKQSKDESMNSLALQLNNIGDKDIQNQEPNKIDQQIRSQQVHIKQSDEVQIYLDEEDQQVFQGQPKQQHREITQQEIQQLQALIPRCRISGPLEFIQKFKKYEQQIFLKRYNKCFQPAIHQIQCHCRLPLKPS